MPIGQPKFEPTPTLGEDSKKEKQERPVPTFAEIRAYMDELPMVAARRADGIREEAKVGSKKDYEMLFEAVTRSVDSETAAKYMSIWEAGLACERASRAAELRGRAATAAEGLEPDPRFPESPGRRTDVELAFKWAMVHGEGGEWLEAHKDEIAADLVSLGSGSERWANYARAFQEDPGSFADSVAGFYSDAIQLGKIDDGDPEMTEQILQKFGRTETSV